MRIAVSAGSGKAGGMATHFGRCACFVIFEAEAGRLMSEKRVRNPFCGTHKPGAVPKFIISQKVDVVITGAAGPNAIETLKSAGIQVVFASGTAREIAMRYIEGKLETSENVCRH